MFRKLVPSQRDTETILRHAMGQLYGDNQARDLLRQRLNGRSIVHMSDDEIYNIVRDVIHDLSQGRLVHAQ